MHSTPRRQPFAVLAILALVSAAVAHAHPGHDGHELTWDFSHLAAHPLATLSSLAVLGLAGWIVWRGARAAIQRFRGSHASRGK